MNGRRVLISTAVLLTAAVVVWFANRKSDPAPAATQSPVRQQVRAANTPDEPGTPRPEPPLPGAANSVLPDAKNSAPDSPRDSAAVATMTPGPAAPNAGPTAPPAPASLEDTDTAAIELDQVSLMLRDYRSRMGDNPVGTNAEIMKAVMGANPRQAVLGPPEGQQLNERGELVDRWGTPYFFHQMSASQTEVHSAGPDKKLGTSDDIIVR